ncbi:MAG: ABC transporter substrate-binding protein [Oscillospiraceae bacterium]|nr:ABC transporter substrate-binding protein [Oscillospiraceae bacterium]MBQ2146280.1 ABC transporter substrate-binding protein [Oscillospiraceae bacterium]MBQ5489592.1 ABC transporter substrate-binding protein [Oscillospiraceae bacterium]
MKKLLALILALCMIFALAACGQSASQSSGDKVVKIGVFEPQSGDNGAGGKQEVLGMQYANKLVPTVEIGGETYSVELVYADNASSNDKAPTAAQTLISSGVSLVLGSYGSGVSIAAGDTFKSAGVPAIGVTCTNPQVTAENEVYFRICFLDPFQGTVLANFAKDTLGAQKAYCLAKQGDDYSMGLCNYFIEAFGEANCVFEQFPEGTSDYSTYVTNAQNQGCDVFFSPVSTEAAAQIIAKADTQALGMPILAGDTWDSNVILNAAKGTDVRICVTTFYQEGADAEFDKGIKEWIKSDSTALANNGGNDELAAVTVMGYDAYFVALEALKAAGSTEPAKVLEVLPSLECTGVTGNISFNEIGDANRDSAFVKECNTETGVWDFVAVATVG